MIKRFALLAVLLSILFASHPPTSHAQIEGEIMGQLDMADLQIDVYGPTWQEMRRRLLEELGSLEGEPDCIPTPYNRCARAIYIVDMAASHPEFGLLPEGSLFMIVNGPSQGLVIPGAELYDYVKSVDPEGDPL